MMTHVQKIYYSIFKIEKLYRLGYIPADKEEMDEIIEQYMDFLYK